MSSFILNLVEHESTNEELLLYSSVVQSWWFHRTLEENFLVGDTPNIPQSENIKFDQLKCPEIYDNCSFKNHNYSLAIFNCEFSMQNL